MDSAESEPVPAAVGEGVEPMPFSESRWPPAIAVFLFMILNITLRIWLPQEPVISAPWLLPTLEAAILGVLVFGHPADLARHRRWLRPTTSRSSSK